MVLPATYRTYSSKPPHPNPFGLLHRGYNEEKHEIQYTEAEEDKIFTPQVVAGHYKYVYQEQERQEDLNLNWDSFKYRNYDYAIGRFMSVDPLAEKYPYNGVYNFSENRVIDARELEGLEAVNADNVVEIFNDNKEAENYRMIIYVDQPGSGGDRDTYEINSITETPDVGHTFVKLVKENKDGTTTSYTFGFYPSGGVDLNNKTTRGIIYNDEDHQYDVSWETSVNKEQFNKMIKYIGSEETTTYDLDDYNCTDFVIQMAKSGGIKLPDTQGKWPFGGGSNPGDFGEDLMEMGGQRNPNSNQNGNNKMVGSFKPEKKIEDENTN